jgi:hypothetical protein
MIINNFSIGPVKNDTLATGKSETILTYCIGIAIVSTIFYAGYVMLKK